MVNQFIGSYFNNENKSNTKDFLKAGNVKK